MKTILLVEDDVSIQELLVDLIAQETSYLTRVAVDAAQAIDIAGRTALDLLVMNYRLPGTMNGIELFDQLHRIPSLEHVPAIMVSAALPYEQLATRNIVGMSKPFKINDLLARIHLLLA
jgi:DNA-binding response OmpR family regulator